MVNQDDTTAIPAGLGTLRGLKMNSDFRQSIAPEDKEELRKLLNALETFLGDRGTMPLQYVRAFLLVALEEGKGVKEYARDAEASVSVMSRHLQDIGDQNREREPGFQWVTQRTDPLENRRHQTLLTDKGKALAAKVVRSLRTFKK